MTDSAAQLPDSALATPSSARRRIVRILLGIGVVAVVAAGLAYLGRDLIIDRAIRNQLSAQPDNSYLDDTEHVRVLLCGTGSPEISKARAQACTLVAAGGKMFLFDAGEGATKSLTQENVDITHIDHVFLTHFHSDHFNGLGTLVNESWIWGRTTPVEVAGPPGIHELVDARNAMYSLDTGYRTEHMNDLATAQEAAQAVPIQIDIPGGQNSTRVYDEGGVTIDAVRVVHDPVEPAYGYVLTYHGKKVFISGDTLVAPQNLPAMRDADVVVHEAYATHLVRRALPVMRELGRTHDADVAERTIDYHADTIALAKQAQQAGVEHLVLTHLTPYPNNFFARRMFVSGMDDFFDGEITLGRDGTLLVI